MWSRKIIESSKHRRSSSAAGSWKKTSAIGGRRIVFEPLEDRRLLSVGMLHAENTSQAAALLASSLSPGSASSVANSNAAISTAAATLPSISQVAFSQAQARITWNVLDALGVASSALQIDGVTVAVAGPFAASNGGVNFSGSFGQLSKGPHTYLITATDTAGNASSATAQFNVAGPAISQVAVSQPSGRITWNVVSPNSVTSTTLQIDGTALPVSGPFAASSGGANFSGPLGSLTPGSHSFTITAIDTVGNTSTNTGTFTINAGPIISKVAVSQSSGRISWNLAGINRVATTTLQIDGTLVPSLSGPFASSSGGVNFSGPLGSPSVGSHTYLITAIDTANNVSTSTAAFNITASTSSGPTISQVAVSQTTGRVSWNVLDSSGVASSTLSIDGVAVLGVLGPFTALSGSGVNFSGPLGTLTSGDHTLSIAATGNDNVTSTFSETFTTDPTTTGTGPTIGNIIVSGPSGTITWTASDSDGVVAANSTLTIDGIAVTPITGPSGTPTSANFSASLGLLNAGSHSFAITATDTLSNTSTLSATFNLTSQTSVGPTLGQVVVSQSKARISWNAFDTIGVTASTISIDGFPVPNVSGPFTVASGVDFSAPLDSLLAGTHTYSITGIDGLGSQETVTNTFTLTATTTFDPMIGQVAIAQARGRISWSVFSPNTITAATLQIDGVNVANVIGPFTASSGVDFSAPLGSLAAGAHTYRITATDKLGRQSSLLANFTLTAATAAAAGATQNAVFSSLADSALANSAKAARTFDLGGLTDSSSSISGASLL
jgi:hypothetical protein